MTATLNQLNTAADTLYTAFVNRQIVEPNDLDWAATTLTAARAQHGGPIRSIINDVLLSSRQDNPEPLRLAIATIAAELAMTHPQPVTTPPTTTQDQQTLFDPDE